MIYFYAIAILSIVAGLCYYIYLLITPKKNQIEKEKERKKDPEIAILIPARNESLVIEDLLDSIEKQTSKINNKNVYIIVESEEDPTVEIVKKHQI